MSDRALQLPAEQIRQMLDDRKQRFRLLVAMLVLLGGSIAIMGSVVIGATDQGTWVVFGVLGLIVAVSIMVRPALGGYILVLFVFLNLSDVLEVAFGIASINKVLVGLIFVGTLANRIVLHHKPLVFRATERAILLYGAVMLVSAIGAGDRSGSLDFLVNWAKDFAILIVIVQIADEIFIWKSMQWMLILAAAFVAMLSVYQMLSGNISNEFFGLAKAPIHEITSGFDSTRVTGPLDDPNFYAQILLMTLPLAAYRFLTGTNVVGRVAGGFASLLIVAAAIFTYSRGGFVAIVVVSVLIIRERRWNPYRAFSIVLLVLAIMLPILPAGYLDRLATLSDIFPSDITMQTENSFRGRTSEMLIAVQMFLDHPVFGVGVANYETLYLDYSSRLGLDDRLQHREAHSLYLETAAETGVVGIISLGIMLGLVFSSIHRAKKNLLKLQRPDLVPWVNGIQLGLVSYLITSIFLHGAYDRYLWLMISFAVSASVISDALVRQYGADHETVSRSEIVFTSESIQIE